MSYSAISLQKKNRIAIISLQYPGHQHTINTQLAAELRQVCQELNQETETMVVILTGTGANFCSGTDWEEVSELAKEGDFTPEHLVARYSAAPAIASIEKPVIAAINGDVLGQGLELALACDIRLSASQARFGFPSDKMKLFPFDGATQLLPRVVGRGRALELLLTGDIISAEDALTIGLINKIAKDKDVISEAEEWAIKMTTRAPLSLRFAKEAILKGMDLTLEQGLRLESDLYFLLHTTADRREGITAFREKRRPAFQGF
jgi:enoyl-CoA hydratase/carnithine racemase